MSEQSKVRLGIIDEMLGSDERVRIDVLALLLEPGGGLGKREAEGHLVLTDRRAIFGTSQHGILVNLNRVEMRKPVSVRHRWMMAHLTVKTEAGSEHTFVVNKRAAREFALTVNRTAG